MKTKNKPRKVWAVHPERATSFVVAEARDHLTNGSEATPFYLIPASEAAHEQRVEAAARRVATLSTKEANNGMCVNWRDVEDIILKFAPPDLSAEVARLREELVKSKEFHRAEVAAKETVIERAQAENEKLRALLSGKEGA